MAGLIRIHSDRGARHRVRALHRVLPELGVKCGLLTIALYDKGSAACQRESLSLLVEPENDVEAAYIRLLVSRFDGVRCFDYDPGA